jgi:aryl carrier-like protein
LPRLANGKVDRARLLGAAGSAVEVVSESWTQFQEEFAGICRDILRCESIGIDDNLFDLGADSLSIIRVFNKLRTRTDAPLTVTDLFKYPTIRALSNELDRRPVSGVI